ncbi:MAG: GerMN domain-containing protein [Patescibacteria group bacterium]|nr:GerMN domain-containing protein [Patescibacteria group bacterium]
MRQLSKLWWLVVALLIGVSMAACSSQRVPPAAQPRVTASPVVAETGTVIDLADRSGDLVVAKPGDVLSVPLIGTPGYQWSFRSPINGGILTMKRHVVTENDARLKKGEVLSEWVFKIEKATTFTLQLDYEGSNTRRQPAKTFRVEVVADRTLEQLPAVILDEPEPNAVAQGKVSIYGYARATVPSLTYRVLDGEGKSVAQGKLAISEPRKDFSVFESQVTFVKPNTPAGKLAVYSGAETTSAQEVPLVFNPQLTTVEVYFMNSKLAAPETCKEVFPVKRYIPKTEAIGTAALNQLIAGPTAAERSAGYTSSIPTGVKLNSLIIRDGVATADFSPALDRNVGGSCRVAAIAAEIMQTLKQFPTVKEVIIAINGRTEDILQP